MSTVFPRFALMTHIPLFAILPAKGGYVCSALLHLHARSDTDEAAWSRNLSRPKDFAYSCLIQQSRKQSQYEIKYTHYPGFTGISLALDYPVILSTRQFADQFRPDPLSVREKRVCTVNSAVIRVFVCTIYSLEHVRRSSQRHLEQETDHACL